MVPSHPPLPFRRPKIVVSHHRWLNLRCSREAHRLLVGSPGLDWSGNHPPLLSMGQRVELVPPRSPSVVGERAVLLSLEKDKRIVVAPEELLRGEWLVCRLPRREFHSSSVGEVGCSTSALE